MSILKRPVKFIKEVRVELSKVSWSTRQELIAATFVVIVAVFFMAIYIGSIDFMLSQILKVTFR